MIRAHGSRSPLPDVHAARFDLLFEATHRQVLAFTLRRTREPADAEDAAAEVFAIAWRRLADVPAGAATLPWLYGVARRVLANHHRGSERRSNLLRRLFERTPVVADGPVPDDPAGDAAGPATAALAALRPDDRELLTLVAWEDLDHGAIAAVLGISVNAVAVRLHRARKRFAAAYARVIAQDSIDLKGTDLGRTSVP